MKKILFAVLLLIIFVTSCQTQEATTPIPFLPSETPVPATMDLPTQTPTPIICETKPPLVELSALPKIPDDNLPAPRLGASMSYDQRREVIVLFGGVSNPDTWEYDGTEWREVSTNTQPPGRSYPSSAYDPRRGVVVMYGGYYEGFPFPNDIWEYNGEDWKEVMLENPPELLRFPVLEYYSPWKKLIAFGEYADSAKYQTWFYDGITWENLDQDLPDIPYPSMLYQTVYDSCRQKLYLVMLPGWLYEFDSTWQILKIESKNRLPIAPSSIVYDSFRDRMVLFGFTWENYGDPWQSETWEFDGVDWQQVQPLASPPPRSGHAMVFDERRGVTVMFGGKTQDGVLLNDLWEYDGTTWVQR